MPGHSATFISAPRSEALRTARNAPPIGPRASGSPSAAAVSGNRSWHQLTSRAPVRRAASQASTEISGGSVLARIRSPGRARVSSARKALAAKLAQSSARPGSQKRPKPVCRRRRTSMPARQARAARTAPLLR